MGKHIMNEEARLLRQSETALRELEKLPAPAPELVRRFRAAQAGLRELTAPTEERFSRYRSPLKVVRACLEAEKKPLAKRVIADMVFRGGYGAEDPNTMDLVVMSIDKNIARGNLTFSDGVVGLPEWEDSTGQAKK